MLMRLLRIAGAAALALFLLSCGMHVVNSGNAPVPESRTDALRIATLNVHYIVMRQQIGLWSVGHWEARKGALDQAFKAVEADIIAFQEMESFGGGDDINLTLDHLLERNPDYRAAAVGDPAVFPSTQPILYRADRLTLRDQGWFFFSDRPEVIYSRTFNGSYPAFASWAEFHGADGPPFRVVNVHLEYSSRSNRRLSAALVRDRIAPVIAAGTPVFLVGDINALHGSRTMGILEEAGLEFLPVDGSTYHFNRGINLFGANDQIGYSDSLVPLGETVVLRRQFDGQWPSDHYPLLADFAWPG